MLQVSCSLEVCVRYLTIRSTAVLSFCRRHPTGRWNGAVSPASSMPVHDLCVIFLVSWMVSVGFVLDYDLSVGFPASWKLLALANTLVLLLQPSFWCCLLFGSAALATLSLGLGLCLRANWSCFSAGAGLLAGIFSESQCQFCGCLCCIICLYKHQHILTSPKAALWTLISLGSL